MVEFNFDKPPVGAAAADITTEFQRQLLPLVNEIVRAAVAAGWNRKDVLLALVDVGWDLYENSGKDL